MDVARSWGIQFTETHINGIKYAEGELDDYSPKHRVSTELAAFTHACDHYSARVRHNYPLPVNDEWEGAHRIANIAPDGVDEATYLEKFEANVEAYVDIGIDAAKPSGQKRSDKI